MTDTWNSIYSNLIGEYVCNTCRNTIRIKYISVSSPKLMQGAVSESTNNSTSDAEMTSDIESDDDSD